MSSTHVGTTRANMHTNASGKRCAVIWCVHLHVCAISIKTAVGSRDFALQCTKMIRFELNVAGASTTSFSSAPHHFGPITSTAQTVRIRYVCVHFCFPWHQFAAHTNRFAKYTCNIRAYNVIWSSDTSFLATICNSVTLNGKFAWKRMPIQSNRIDAMRLRRIFRCIYSLSPFNFCPIPILNNVPILFAFIHGICFTRARSTPQISLYSQAPTTTVHK